jgi:hypothetical protein
MIETVTHNHNGVTYKKVQSTRTFDSALAFGDSKYVLTGFPAIEIMEGSYKFGNQVQLTVYNKSNSVKKSPRTTYAGNYDRLEIFIDKQEFIEMCRKFLETI